VQAAFLAANGIRTVFVTGTTGECHSLTGEERVAIYDAWADAASAHGLAVIGHVGGNSIEDACMLARRARDHRFAAISTLPPSYFKPASLGDLVDWCARIAAEAPDLPFYYYDIPSMSGVSFPIEQLLIEAPPRIRNIAAASTSPANGSICRGARTRRFLLRWPPERAVRWARPITGRRSCTSI
jgi:N-acetylneuraminate lyase